MRHLDADAALMTPAEIEANAGRGYIALGTLSDPGGLMQWRAGTARHDAVAWGYARGQRSLGLLENGEVTGFIRDGDRIVGVRTSRGEIRAKKVAVAVAGSTGHVMRMAGVDKMPIESHVLGLSYRDP
jgi:sarcosine oxidase subunit beta